MAAPFIILFGCVGVDPPEKVVSCAKQGNCSDDPNANPPEDAKRNADRFDPPDLLSPDQPIIPSGLDAAPDAPIKMDTKVNPLDAGLDRALTDGPKVDDSNADHSPLQEAGSSAESGVAPDPDPGPEPRPEPGPDGGSDVGSPSCTVVSGTLFRLGTTKAACFVTCDIISTSFSCSSFSPNDRPVKINGKSLTACDLNQIPTGTRTHSNGGAYYYFEIGPGGHDYDQVNWSGTSVPSCPPPPGGFTP